MKSKTFLLVLLSAFFTITATCCQAVEITTFQGNVPQVEADKKNIPQKNKPTLNKSKPQTTSQFSEQERTHKPQGSAASQQLTAINISILSPAGGKPLNLGGNETIRYKYSGPTPSKIRFHLFKGTKKLGLIKEMFTTRQGVNQFNWSVGKYTGGKTSSGKNYKIRATVAGSNNHVFGKTFAISKKTARGATTLTITSPNGGELLKSGVITPITFNYSGPTPVEVRLHLFKKNQKLGQIIQTSVVTEGMNSINWKAGYYEGVNAGHGEKFRIRAKVVGKALLDFSDDFFSIIPKWTLEKKKYPEITEVAPPLSQSGNNVPVSLDPIEGFLVSPGINEMNVKVTASPKAFITVKFHKQPVPSGRECDPTYQPYRGTVSGGYVTTFDETIGYFERNTNYIYEICAKSEGVDYRRTGQRETLAGEAIRILFDKIIVTDDSDDLSAGDLTFYYQVHDHQYRVQNVTVDTGGSFTPAAFFDVDPGLDSVKIWVRGQDNDCTSFFIKPDNCVGDYGEVKTNLDLKSMVGDTKKFSYTADHHGVGFTVQGTIKIYDPNP